MRPYHGAYLKIEFNKLHLISSIVLHDRQRLFPGRLIGNLIMVVGIFLPLVDFITDVVNAGLSGTVRYSRLFFHSKLKFGAIVIMKIFWAGQW